MRSASLGFGGQSPERCVAPGIHEQARPACGYCVKEAFEDWIRGCGGRGWLQWPGSVMSKV